MEIARALGAGPTIGSASFASLTTASES